jgi:hypothetical protein
VATPADLALELRVDALLLVVDLPVVAVAIGFLSFRDVTTHSRPVPATMRGVDSLTS